MKLFLIAPSTRAMAESAKKAGYNFISLDFFGDADQKEICENYSLNHEFKEEYTIENLFKHAQDLEFTHVVYGSGFENHPELVAEFEKRCIVLGNDSDTLRKVRDWEYLFRELRRRNVPFPGTEIIAADEAKEIIKSERNWLIKPIKSGGGHSIYDRQNILEMEEPRSKVLLQEYIEGKPVSSTVICAEEGCFCTGSTEQIVGTFFNKYRYAGNIAPLDEGKEVIEKIEETSCKISHAFKLKGSNGIDFILKNGEPYVLEVNPRITGSMEVLERAHGTNILDLHVKACLKENFDLKVKKSGKFWSKKILFADRDIIYKERLDFIKDVPHYGERIDKESPICTVLGEGKTRGECCADLLNKERLVYESLRKDNIQRHR
jgi:hypothetical protein